MQSWHRRYCTMRRDIVYYGDGEGAFRVSRISEKGIFCVAKNDFYMGNQYLVDILNRIKPL